MNDCRHVGEIDAAGAVGVCVERQEAPCAVPCGMRVNAQTDVGEQAILRDGDGKPRQNGCTESVQFHKAEGRGAVWTA